MQQRFMANIWKALRCTITCRSFQRTILITEVTNILTNKLKKSCQTDNTPSIGCKHTGKKTGSDETNLYRAIGRYSI